MTQPLNLEQLPLKGKRVILRVDFNVPFNLDQTIADDTRIRAAIPTIEYILTQGASLVILSHLGRPKGKVLPEMSLAPVAEALRCLLNYPIVFCPSPIGEESLALADKLQPGEVLLLENLRFELEETKPTSDQFSALLAKHGDLFVNDAFGAAHRAHSSTTKIVKYFPNKAAMGLLMEQEVRNLNQVLKKPKRPFVAVIGGAKISSKIGILTTLIEKVDCLIIGGAMAYTFLYSQGVDVANSLIEKTYSLTAREIVASCQAKGIPIHLPVDCIATTHIAEDVPVETCSLEKDIPEGYMGLDIGPKTVENFQAILKTAKTVLWNGPMGVIEIPQFAQGTYAIAETIASLDDAMTVVGGGESVAAIQHLGMAESFSHISTGGGATLEYIETGHLPGIDVLIPKSVASLS